MILTRIAHRIATAERGYEAIGGEFLILPLLIVIAMEMNRVKYMIEEIREVFIEGNEEECQIKKTSSTSRC